jgi:hypothetical protein
VTYEEILKKQLRQAIASVVIGGVLIIACIGTGVWMIISKNALPFMSWLALAALYIVINPILCRRRDREAYAAALEYYSNN